ncbi:Rid family detoxifying hydrolase [Miltoncostaea marina]|uniref:Rid family detoxifying hydrolase n=1 Tax=Miltoncostaea marina TaxID=2843215 RepID=UPI001C3C253F|nr:Rid family detoxifying hydrolase [Miltoncostaea marina]
MRIVRTEAAPAPVAGAPYSQAVVAGAGRTVHVSGQLGIDPATGALVDGGVREQTAAALRNVAAILDAAGARLGDVVATTVYLADLAADFPGMNAAYAEGLAGHAPARATVGVAALPMGARVEIAAVAVIGAA